MKSRDILLGAVLVLLGICIGVVATTCIDASAKASWWDMVTAFGTAGSAIVATWFATQDQRRLRATEARRARIAAPAVMTQIDVTNGIVSAVRRGWTSDMDSFLSPQKRENARDCLIRASRTFNIQQIEAIGAMDETCAQHIIDGQGGLDIVAEALSHGVGEESYSECVQALATATKSLCMAASRLEESPSWK